MLILKAAVLHPSPGWQRMLDALSGSRERGAAVWLLGRRAVGKSTVLQGKEAALQERAPFPAPLGTPEQRQLYLANWWPDTRQPGCL